MSASKPWHPNHLENKRVSACCHFGAEFAASSCLSTDIIILLEGVCGAGFELCSPFWILSLFSAVAPVCFPLARFSSSRHGPVMLLHGTLAHTFPIFDFECLLSLTDPPRLSQSYRNGKGKKDGWFNLYIVCVLCSHHHLHHFQICFCKRVICVLPNVSI